MVKYEKIGFTGTRDGMTQKQKAELTMLLIEHMPAEFHHGDCTGADEEAHEIAKMFPLTRIIGHPPDIAKHRAFCKFHESRHEFPYLERNRHIVDEVEFLAAAPKEVEEKLRSGTWATIRYARKRGVPMQVMEPE